MEAVVWQDVLLAAFGFGSGAERHETPYHGVSPAQSSRDMSRIRMIKGDAVSSVTYCGEGFL